MASPTRARRPALDDTDYDPTRDLRPELAGAAFNPTAMVRLLSIMVERLDQQQATLERLIVAVERQPMALQEAARQQRIATAQRMATRAAQSRIAPGPDLTAPEMTEVASAIAGSRERERQLTVAERGHPLLRHGGTRADGTPIPPTPED